MSSIPREILGGRVALVTGAGSGIGRAAAQRLARAGARVALLGRTAPALESFHAELLTEGRESLVCVADVTDADALARAVHAISNAWGRLDIVVANAGINGVWCPLDELTPDEWDRTLDINLRGAFLTLRSAHPLLRRNGGSAIVMASVNGTRMFSNTGATAYSVANAGRVALTKMLALELAPQRIRVNAICPGSIDTNIDDNTEARHLESIRTKVVFPDGAVPLTGGEPGEASQVAELVLFLASDAASHLTGAVIHVDGGQSLLQG